MINVATIGGGNAHAITLRALKQLKLDGIPLDITAIVSVADSGGSSGRLRKECGMLPPGDLLRASMALSEHDFEWLRRFFYEQRFTGTRKDLEGHNVGNLLIKYLCDQTGGMVQALSELNVLWKLHGTVLPISLDQIELCAELENGAVVRGETHIDVPKYDPQIRKTRVWLEPEGSLLPEAREAIKNAHYIIFGPGDLFTSILPGLLMAETREAIQRSKARIVFVSSLANRLCGETLDFTAADHIRELHEYLPRACYIVVSHAYQNSKHPEAYDAKGWQWMVRDAEESGVSVIQGDLEHDTGAGMDYAKLIPLLSDILV
ncbi:MAG: YvcK family protein [Candidatus Magasanikbacteria bacterium]|nr:YvcK family protein [Candidatus Magasanikbacteria bacterium]